MANTPTKEAVNDKDDLQIIESTNLHDAYENIDENSINATNKNKNIQSDAQNSNDITSTSVTSSSIANLRNLSMSMNKKAKFKSFLNDSDTNDCTNLFKHHQQLPLTRSISLRTNRNFTIAQTNQQSSSVKTSNSMKYENAQQYNTFTQQQQQQMISTSTQSGNRRMAILSQSSSNSTTFSDIIENEMKLENFIGSFTNFA
jgi:hypothetical protein